MTHEQLVEEKNREFNKAMLEYLNSINRKHSALSGRPDDYDDDDVFPEFYSVRKPFNDLLTTTAQRVREETIEEVRQLKKTGNNGEGLPFENSPDIYGNQRVEAYKNGFNSAIDQVLSTLSK